MWRRSLAEKPLAGRRDGGNLVLLVMSVAASERILLMIDTPKDTYSEAETDARREAALKRMLATPPKPHKESARRKGRSRP